jgi:hypothetical protein
MQNSGSCKGSSSYRACLFPLSIAVGVFRNFVLLLACSPFVLQEVLLFLCLLVFCSEERGAQGNGNGEEEKQEAEAAVLVVVL